MQEKALFSREELHLLTNKQVFTLKNNITHKLQELLWSVNEQLEKEKLLLSDKLPSEVLVTKGKVSRGENYSGYPWQVLDNPRLFNKDHVFAFRTMCWWGHEFSFTLHLSGIYLEKIREHLTERFQNFTQKDIYICVNDSPWTYHFESGNYQLLHSIPEEWSDIASRDFIKLSRRLKIEDAPLLKQSAAETFQMFIHTLL